MPARRLLFDEALRSAWRRVLRLWRPMAAWTLLVWGGVALLLAPLSSAVLGWGVRGPREVVGNEEILAWLFTPAGVAYLFLAGGLGLTGAVVRYAGLFQIVTDDLEGRTPTVRLIALELVPRVPALFRLCLWAVAAGLVLILPLAAGLGGVYVLLLREHDINYYLAVRPGEWRGAVAASAVLGVAWGGAVAWAVGRSLLALPAYLDGHRPARVALRRAWKRTRDGAHGVRLLRLLALAVGGWLLFRAGVDAAFVTLASAGVEWVAATFSSSLRPLVFATAIHLGLSVALDAAIAFIGFAFVSTVLTKFYYEDTDLHGAAPHDARLRDVPAHVVGTLRPWLRPARLLAVGAPLALVSVVASGLLLERVPEPRTVWITAHRAGPPPAPENTLAALERSIEAGAHFAEIDVQRTRDGVVVVAHDADLMRAAGDPRRIAATDFADLAAIVQRPDDGSPPGERRLATLDDFLERARGRIRLNIELKYYGPDPGLAPAVVERVRAAEMEEEVVLMSLGLDAVHQLRRLAPGIPVGYVAAAAVGDLTRLPVDFLAVARPLADPRLLRAARERGLEVHVWTVNRADRMAELVERGVDGIITDDPALAVAVNRQLVEMSPMARLLLRVRGLLPEGAEP